MIHLAIPCNNTRRPEPARCMGLGDRIVPLRIAYARSLEAGCPVTLHLTRAMHAGPYALVEGQPPRGEMFVEALGLFPPGHITLMLHPFQCADQRAWIARLGGAETWYLGDTLGLMPYEERIGFDASPYLRASPLLPPPADAPGLTLPTGPFVTMQPSGSVAENRCTDAERAGLIDRWRARGYEVVIVGHEATEPLLARSLRHMAYAQSRAEFHVGADSGPMHVASLFKPYGSLRLISPGRVSRNRAHWLANGVAEEPR